MHFATLGVFLPLRVQGVDKSSTLDDFVLARASRIAGEHEAFQPNYRTYLFVAPAIDAYMLLVTSLPRILPTTMAVFTKEDDWYEGALSVEMPCRPGPVASQWSDDESGDEADGDDDAVDLPIGEEPTEEDPFGDFDEDDFDDDFDDDFEEELEDDYEIEPDDSEMFTDDEDDDDAEFEEDIVDDDA